MSGFVDECRKEWDRLGVSESVANEMAADLSADLAEAQAEGVSPEEVLGNAVFDARSFAASWARARGVVPGSDTPPARPHWSRWALAGTAIVSLVVGAVGLAILASRSSSAVAAVDHRGLQVRPPVFRPPAFHIIGPGFGQVVAVGSSVPPVLGLVLLAAGLVGLGVTLWVWRPWSLLRPTRGFDDSVGLPSYL